MDRAKFFEVMRAEFGALSQSQVDGTEFLLDHGEERSTPLRQLAYVLSTAWHETASTMEAIAEYGLGAGHEYGEPCPEYDNQVAYGRGYVQLTWQENYEKADKECALDHALLDDFELALDGPIAAKIIFEGMSAGWFTGKKLDDYINASLTDYYNARRIVNGTDKADLLRGYAETYQEALEAARYGEAEPVDPDEITTPPDVAEHPPVEPPPHTWPERTRIYEYVTGPYTGDVAEMNQLGAKGWRLAHIHDGEMIWERVK